jgi:hypothetical protein
MKPPTAEIVENKQKSDSEAGINLQSYNMCVISTNLKDCQGT